MELQDLLFDHSLQFYYEIGAVTPVQTGPVAPWRTMPSASIAHVTGGRWRVECEGQPAYFVESGEVSFMPAGVRHRTFMVTPATSVSRWAHFNVFLCGFIDLFSFFDVPPILRGEAATRLGDLLFALGRAECSDEPLRALLQRKNWEFEIATILIENAPPRYGSEIRLQHIQRVLPVLETMNGDLSAAHNRETLAKVAHLSPSRFAALFKEAVGLAPIDYLLRLRMQRARQLLSGSDWTISQIARAVGYSDAFYFSRLFKTHFGFSPKKYRDATRRDEL